MEKILFKDESYKIIGACFEVYKSMGCDFLEDLNRAQVLNYLNATGFELGLLVNFGHNPKIEHERFILTDHVYANKKKTSHEIHKCHLI
ncbi:MAG: hypothetical protein ISR82_00875 [Candidatus Marinimicrobia bacterium]|nr:hypothetical protein [Candidatus Neomarinimicrobiota bacterium]MBL7009758.1 hypothetical protein [Candidatus Neomarinimicrobiota bacterium]MBL7029838.1 hypothetical protein [Candidatus Neomarinimicrobiota bacterium]